jgi:transforming growth factor-beta-induced protein
MEEVSSALLSMSEGDLDSLLSYHITVGNGGPHYTTGLQNGTTLQTLEGGQLTISFADNSLFVNSARILTSDLLIAGGVMHVIDNVLDPGNAAAQPVPRLATQVPVLQTGASKFQTSAAPFTTWLPDLTQNAVAEATSTGGSGCYGCDGGGSGGAAATTSYYLPPTMTPVAAGEAGRSFDRRFFAVGLAVLAFMMFLM